MDVLNSWATCSYTYESYNSHSFLPYSANNGGNEIIFITDNMILYVKYFKDSLKIFRTNKQAYQRCRIEDQYLKVNHFSTQSVRNHKMKPRSNSVTIQ